MSRIWSREPSALWRRCGERVVLLASEEDQILVLSGTGGLTWDLLAEPIADADLMLTLAELHAIETEIVEREARPFLEMLRTAGAVAFQ